MKKHAISALLAFAAAGAIAEDAPRLTPAVAKKLARCGDDCGVVQGVLQTRRQGEGGAVGILAGAAAGGLLGNQVGGGSGKTIATIGGAVAGGFAGNEVQKRVTATKVWITDVKMRDGTVRQFEHHARPAWAKGSVVQVNGSRVRLAAGG